MTIEGLKTYLSEHYESLISSILAGTYRPMIARKKILLNARMLAIREKIDLMQTGVQFSLTAPLFEAGRRKNEDFQLIKTAIVGELNSLR